MTGNSSGLDDQLSAVLKEAVDGDRLLPKYEIKKTSKSLILQGILYTGIGLFLLLLPGLFNTVMLFYPEPFSADETLLYRTTGYFIVGVGYYYIQAGRMNKNFWAVATIFGRMTIVPVFCMVLWLHYGGPAPLCIAFALLDPFLALLTYMTLTKEEERGVTFTSMGGVFREALSGDRLLPKFGTINATSKFLFLQGVLIESTGLLLFFQPGVFNKMMNYPEPFTAEETPLYRTAGFPIIMIGLFYLQNSRMGENFWAVASISFRMTITPALGIFIWKVYGCAPQVCLVVATIDPILSFLTFLSLKKDVGSVDAKKK